MLEMLGIVGAELFREGVEIEKLALIMFLVLVAKKFRSYRLVVKKFRSYSLVVKKFRSYN